MNGKSRDPGYFERLYAANPDPWNFETSAYEQEKYQSTLEVLGGRRFRKAFEVGCSIGVLTKQLAAHCGSLLAADIAPNALAMAEARCSGLDHVTFRSLHIPAEWPEEEIFDLILFSEILYFLSPAEIAQTADRVRACLAPGGIVVLVNYTAPIEESCSGEEAAQHFIAACGLGLLKTVSHDKYRIDVLGDDPDEHRKCLIKK